MQGESDSVCMWRLSLPLLPLQPVPKFGAWDAGVGDPAGGPRVHPGQGQGDDVYGADFARARHQRRREGSIDGSLASQLYGGHQAEESASKGQGNGSSSESESEGERGGGERE